MIATRGGLALVLGGVPMSFHPSSTASQMPSRSAHAMLQDHRIGGIGAEIVRILLDKGEKELVVCNLNPRLNRLGDAASPIELSGR